MSPRLTIKLTVLGGGYSPPPRGGVDATSKKCREASFEERTGWSLTSHISECVLNTACERPRYLMAAPYYLRFRAIALTLRAGLRGAPPAVRAASEASRHFLTGAATPPLGGGE